MHLLCLISNTMPQLEQSSLQPSTDLQHRHLLQTTSYNHLLLLHLLISRKGKPKQQQARTPPPPRRGVEKPEGPSALQPTAEVASNMQYESFDNFCERVERTCLEFSPEIVDRTISSMPKRIDLVIKGKGNRTKY